MAESGSAEVGQHKDPSPKLPDCPSSYSSLMSNSQYGQVIFHDIYDLYPTDCDLNFHFTLTETVRPRNGDRIALYNVGWKLASDFFVNVPVNLPMNEENLQPCSTLRSSFLANVLPKDENELYQLCYVTVDDKVIGASTPFTFRRPHESDLCCTEERGNPGLIVYKSRIAVLNDKLTGMEDEKEEAELKVFTLSNKVSILEKELSSANFLNKDLSKSLENAKEDVNLLTENLKRSREEFKELQSELKRRENEFIDIEVKCEKLNMSKDIKEDELNSVRKELNNTKQEKIHAELILKEVKNYNDRLKKDLDNLKEEKESLLISVRSLQEEFFQLLQSKEQIEAQLKQNLQQQQQNQSNNEQTRVLNVPGFNTAVDGSNHEGLQLQLNQALELLDETLQRQTALNDEKEKSIHELEDKINSMRDELIKQTEENTSFKVTVTKQYEEIRNMSDELMELKSIRENNIQKESQLTNEINELTRAKETAVEINESVLSRLHELEDELKKNKDGSASEINILKNKIASLEKDGNSRDKIEELETVITCLRSALLTKPNLEEFCHMIFESTRVTAMDTYKDLFSSVQFLDFENAEIGAKVRRLLDEFAILKQDLDRCRLELGAVYKERDQLKSDFTRINDENILHKSRVLEQNEIINEMTNCLDAVKKENNEIQPSKAVKIEKDETQLVKELKEELESVKKKKDEIEKQLKDAKIANALTTIGRVTVGESSLLSEVDHLRSRIKELEARMQLSPAGSQKCCVKLQEQLKRSAKEYAKLYHQLETEREHYQKLLSSVNNFQRPPKSLTSPANDGSPLSPSKSS